MSLSRKREAGLMMNKLTSKLKSVAPGAPEVYARWPHLSSGWKYLIDPKNNGILFPEEDHFTLRFLVIISSAGYLMFK